MNLKFNYLIPVSLKVEFKNKMVKYHTGNIGKIVNSEIKNGQLNIIVKIYKNQVNKIKRLLSQPEVISAEIIKNEKS
jgi:hypothetical protein